MTVQMIEASFVIGFAHRINMFSLLLLTFLNSSVLQHRVKIGYPPHFKNKDYSNSQIGDVGLGLCFG